MTRAQLSIDAAREKVDAELQNSGCMTVTELARNLLVLSRLQIVSALEALKADGRISAVRYGRSTIWAPIGYAEACEPIIAELTARGPLTVDQLCAALPRFTRGVILSALAGLKRHGDVHDATVWCVSH